MNRRRFAQTLLAGALAGFARPAVAQGDALVPLVPAWQAWKAAYLHGDGRVIDALQDQASHSESQGYGLALAAIFSDLAAFNLIYGWTETNLRVRGDRLLAWRWLPDTDLPVPDRNNASDGDLFYAWGLVMGAAAFRNPQLLDLARGIAQDLLARCVSGAPDGSAAFVLLPAAAGFRHGDTIVFNPSYIMPRALYEVAEATGTPDLARCADDGMNLTVALAQRGLVPDWVAIGPKGFEPPPGRLSPASGYDALRVPLYLLWSGRGDHPAVSRQADFFRADLVLNPGAPTPLVSNTASQTVTERSPDPGYAAVRALILCANSGPTSIIAPPYSAKQPYYAGTLHLMTMLVEAESYPTCFPL